jgi:hypothetical protein
VAELGARVVIEAPSSLVPLLRTLGAGCEVIATGEPRPDYDWQCPLLSLPGIFGTALDSVPRYTPYLAASPQRRAAWIEHLPAGLKIGVTASGNPNHQADRHRSIALERLAPLLAIPASFHLLQRDLAATDESFLARSGRIVDHRKDLGDFADTAALVACMDLVISVDTSIVHLAGALGRPVWVLLAFTADWRWLRDRDDSPWYPSARLFRQRERGGWDEVVSRVATALGTLTPQPA